MSLAPAMFQDRRRPPLDAALLSRLVLVWAVVSVLQLLTNSVAIWQMRFPDPDDTLRLVEVRDWLAGQSWFDVHQYRIDAPAGVAMHWSRLVDVPIAAVILVLKPLFGQPAAELAALIAIPLLTLGMVFLLVGRIAGRIFNEEIAGLACLACALAVPLVHQLRPMRIDHHGWQIVAALFALNGLMARDARRGGWTIGAALAVWLAISIEGLPLAACLVGLTALKWLRNRAERWWMVHTMCALAATSAALFVATRGLGDLAQHCDAISPVHLAIFAGGAAATALVAALEPHPRSLTIGGLALTAAGAILILRHLAPQCAGGAFVEIDPLVRRFWYEGALEGQPLWKDTFSNAVTTLGLPLLGLLASFRLIGPSSDWLKRWWIDYTLLLAAAIVVTLFVARAGGTACALAAVPMGWQLREWIRAARNMREPRRRVIALAGVMLALAPALPFSLLVMATPSRAAFAGGPGTAAPRFLPRAIRVSSCRIDEAAVALRRLPPSRILAPLDIGPRLLYDTDHSVVATGHHRAAAAMHDVIHAFTASEATAHAIVRRRGLAYVALCPDLVEPLIYQQAAPRGFAAQLLDGRAPDWLAPVTMPANATFRLWRVVG